MRFLAAFGVNSEPWLQEGRVVARRAIVVELQTCCPALDDGFECWVIDFGGGFRASGLVRYRHKRDIGLATGSCRKSQDDSSC